MRSKDQMGDDHCQSLGEFMCSVWSVLQVRTL